MGVALAGLSPASVARRDTSQSRHSRVRRRSTSAPTANPGLPPPPSELQRPELRERERGAWVGPSSSNPAPGGYSATRSFRPFAAEK